MSWLTFYGGIGEVGGNKILLEDGGRRVWFDFGMSFDQSGKYFAEFLQPKKYNGVVDFLEMGLLPRLADMAGLYRQDYLAHAGLETWDRSAYDAVFLSHAHADHCFYIHFLRREIPIYASEVTRRILGAIETTSPSGFTDFLTFKETFKLRTRKKGEGWMRIRGEEAKSDRQFRVVGDGERVLVGDVAIEALPVNHSIPGSLGFIIHTSKGALVYSGDLRFHGYGGELTARFAARAAGASPVALICEGTRIEGKESLSEQDVQDRAAGVVRDTANLVIVNYPWKDIERMRSFYEVARSCGRRLAINLKQAYLLKMLEGTAAGAPSLSDDNIALYVRRKDWGLITKSSFPREIVEQDYEPWEREFLNCANSVTCQDISRDQGDFIVRIDFFELGDLIDLRPAPGSCYIRSVTEPLDEEAEIELWRAENWLKHFGLYPYHQIHASGHASRLELKELIEGIGPKLVYPVHTEHPEQFQEIVPRGTEVVFPERGKVYRWG